MTFGLPTSAVGGATPSRGGVRSPPNISCTHSMPVSITATTMFCPSTPLGRS